MHFPVRSSYRRELTRYPSVRRKARAAPKRQIESKTVMTITTMPIFGSAAAQPERISGRTASMAHVMGLSRARTAIHAGMADSGTRAVLRKIIGRGRKARIHEEAKRLINQET